MEKIMIDKDDQEYIKYFEKYYKLKSAYYEKNKKRISSIKGDNKLTLKKKMKKMKKMKIYCIQCERDGGTVFEEKGRELHAYCNSKTDKCELDLHLKKASTMYLPDTVQSFNDELNIIKEKIVKTKLDNIFDLEKEEITTQKFNVLKEEYKEKNKIHNTLKNKLNEYLNYKWESKEDQEKLLEVKELVKENIKSFNSFKSVYKNLIKRERTELKPNTLLEEAIRYYKKNLLPLNEIIRDLKYKFIGIEFVEKNKFEKKLLLKKHKNTIREYCIQWEAPKIISKDISDKILKKKKNKDIVDQS